MRAFHSGPALLEVCGFDSLPHQGLPGRCVDEDGVARIVHAPMRRLVPGEWVFSRMMGNRVRLEEERGPVSTMGNRLRASRMEALPDYGEPPGGDGKVIRNHRMGRMYGFEMHFVQGIAKIQGRMGLAFTVRMALVLARIDTGQEKRMRSRVEPFPRADTGQGSIDSTYGFRRVTSLPGPPLACLSLTVRIQAPVHWKSAKMAPVTSPKCYDPVCGGGWLPWPMVTIANI